VLPPVLVLHLKRFSYDAAIGSVINNSKPVQFSSELEIPPGTFSYILSSSATLRVERGSPPFGPDLIAPGARQPACPARYTLYGVLYHHGKSGVEGHYTVDVLHPNAHADGGDVWLHIDDETVSTLRHEDVFGRHDNERVDDRCAHLLFYRRTASPQTG
jgi:ubiquitin carboxyl-terminal hydrolase 10